MSDGPGSTMSGRRPAWCGRSFTRAHEIAALAEWAARAKDVRHDWIGASRLDLKRAIDDHLGRAYDAMQQNQGRFTHALHIDAALSSIDAAEAELLYLAPAEYVVGQLPSILNTVERHLQPTDPRRLELERLVREVTPAMRCDVDEPVTGVSDDAVSSGPAAANTPGSSRLPAHACVDRHRSVIVGAFRGASSAALREQIRVRSFRNAVVAASAAMVVVSVGLIVLGALAPATIPLCFAPEELDQVTVVCPTTQSGPISPTDEQASVSATQIETEEDANVSRLDVALVSIVGATGASVAAAAAIRKLRGSSEPYGVPIALAVLKLPTGAITAVLGITLMRGGFVPGLSALDTSAQILAWAAVFGYAQQLFTRLVDQQAHAVLDGVRGADKGTQASRSL